MNSLSSPIDLIRESLKIFFKKESLIYFVKIYLVALALALVSAGLGFLISDRGLADRDQIWRIILLPSLVFLPISVWAQASGYEAVKRVVGGGTLDFKDTYKTSWKYLWRFFLVTLVTGLIIAGGLVLLIIPGIIFGVWFSFSGWGVVNKGFGVRQSLGASKALVKGKFWKVFGRLLVIVIFAVVVQTVLSVIPFVGPFASTVFGALFLLPYFLLYRELGTESEGKI